jgi:integrase
VTFGPLHSQRHKFFARCSCGLAQNLSAKHWPLPRPDRAYSMLPTSKTPSGTRAIPLSPRCKTELLRWRNLFGPEFSEWVFPNFSNRRHPLQGGRKAWASTLKAAGLQYFPPYYLRHTFASRLTAADVSPLTIAQMLGHSSTQIVPRYAQVLDQNRIDAMKKLEALKKSAIGSEEVVEAATDETVRGMRQ